MYIQTDSEIKLGRHASKGANFCSKTNLEESPMLAGRSKLSSLLLRKIGVEQS